MDVQEFHFCIMMFVFLAKSKYFHCNISMETNSKSYIEQSQGESMMHGAYEL